MIGKIGTSEMMEEVRKRFSGITTGRKEYNNANVELVQVEKEEFDHYSLDSTLMEDHRMNNYVWGLCRLFDESQCYFVCTHTYFLA